MTASCREPRSDFVAKVQARMRGRRPVHHEANARLDDAAVRAVAANDGRPDPGWIVAIQGEDGIVGPAPVASPHVPMRPIVVERLRDCLGLVPARTQTTFDSNHPDWCDDFYSDGRSRAIPHVGHQLGPWIESL